MFIKISYFNILILKLLKVTNLTSDINECGSHNGGCDQICKNEEGSFYCDCMEGYTLGPDGESCNDADECKINNGGCDHVRLFFITQKNMLNTFMFIWPNIGPKEN